MTARTRRRNAVLDALSLIRRDHGPIGLTGVIAYLYVAENPGVGIAELADLCGTTEATASRTARGLMAAHIPGSLPPHLDLLQVFVNPGDTRGRLLHLSPTGETLRERLDRIIARADPIASAERCALPRGDAPSQPSSPTNM